MKQQSSPPYHKEAKAAAKLRRQQIVALIKRGYSYSQIGSMMDPPISRQRVGQLAAKAKTDG